MVGQGGPGWARVGQVGPRLGQGWARGGPGIGLTNRQIAVAAEYIHVPLNRKEENKAQNLDDNPTKKTRVKN